MEPIHLLAIYLYSSNETIYKKVNQTLLNWDQNENYHQFIFTLYQAIHLIPLYKGETYRSVDINFNLNDYIIGKKIKWNSFNVSSLQWSNCGELINNKKRGIVFIIKNLTARIISPYSKYPADCEVVHLPKTEFIITNYYKPSIIALGQQNIRKTTFAIADLDLEKACASKASIIIELEECDNSLPQIK